MTSARTTTLPDVSRAAVFDPVERRMVLRELMIPSLSEGEMLVQVECCTLCGSDAHTVAGRRSCAGPTILGHEIVGRIVAIADASPARDARGRPLSIGSRVTWSIVRGCGDCFYCHRGLPQKCEHLFKYGHSTLSQQHPLSGGLAEFCVLVSGTRVFEIDTSVPLPLAATTNCALATSAAAIHSIPTWDDARVLVIGTGMLGLATIAMARRRGATEILAIDPRADRRKLAGRFGATQSADPESLSNDPQRWTDAITEGRGFDVVIDMSGSADAIQQAPEWLRIGGQLLLVGSVASSPHVPFDPEQIVRKMLVVRGLHNYNESDLSEAVQFVESSSNELPWATLFSRPYSLNEIEAAFREALAGVNIRVAVFPAEGSSSRTF